MFQEVTQHYDPLQLGTENRVKAVGKMPLTVWQRFAGFRAMHVVELIG
jgi:hypothetical protein